MTYDILHRDWIQFEMNAKNVDPLLSPIAHLKLIKPLKFLIFFLESHV